MARNVTARLLSYVVLTYIEYTWYFLRHTKEDTLVTGRIALKQVSPFELGASTKLVKSHAAHAKLPMATNENVQGAALNLNRPGIISLVYDVGGRLRCERHPMNAVKQTSPWQPRISKSTNVAYDSA